MTLRIACAGASPCHGRAIRSALRSSVTKPGRRKKSEALKLSRAAQTSVQARLCAAAGTATTDKLPELEDAAARKREAQKHLSALRQQLAKASARSEDELRKSLVGLDAVAIESERERCRAGNYAAGSRSRPRRVSRRSRRGMRLKQSTHRIGQPRRAKAWSRQPHASGEPCGLGRDYGSRTRCCRRLSNRFRERAQAPMVAAASTYFSLMTGGRYVRLEADEEGEKPVLRAVQADGAKKGIEAMSDGTSDQLYLALRLAALDLRRASHPHMPLVLDDVLITSDDERAANILRALARFAEGGQVMIFTHHHHLIDVARAALDDQALAVHIL